MTKKFLTFGILIVVLLGIFVPCFHFADAQEKSATETAKSFLVDKIGDLFQVVGATTFGPLFAAGGYILMTLSSVILIITGFIFDTVVNHTIVNVSTNIGNDSSMGKSISEAWVVLRDIANMMFIFVILYAAFKAMFDASFGSAGTIIKNIIIVALLINFSLFFTKVVIDASNIVSVGFYKAIATNNYQLGVNLPGSGGTANFSGISGGYMRMLGLQTWWGSNVLENGLDARKIFVTAFMSSVFMLSSAVIFLIAGIMFAARFIILIFLMILSPLALVAFAIPGMRGQFNKWLQALIDQSFFAPLFFALTWVAFKLGNSLITPKASWADIVNDPFQNQTATTALLLNYVLVMGFSIAALVISKQMAKSTPFFSAITGAIGTATVGTTAWAGRNTIGRGSKWITETQRENWSKSGLGRAGLWLADKGSSGSFDIRAIDTLKKVPGLGDELGTIGKAGGKGGFSEAVKKKAEEKEKYGKRIYSLSDTEKELLRQRQEEEKGDIIEERKKIAAESKEKAEKAKRGREEYLETELKPNKEVYEQLKKDKQEKEKRLQEETKTNPDSQESQFLRKEVDSITARMANERELMKEKEQDLEKNNNVYKNLKSIESEAEKAAKKAKERMDKKDIDKEEYSAETQELADAGKRRQLEYYNRLKSQFGAGSQAAARKVRDVAEGKDKKDKKKLWEDLKNELGGEEAPKPNTGGETTTGEGATGGTGGDSQQPTTKK